MKKTLGSLGLGLALLIYPAPAQQYGPIATLAPGDTYILNASSASNLNAVVPCMKYDSFDIELGFKLMTPGLLSMDMKWDTSYDGTNFVNTGTAGQGYFKACLANGTNPIVWRTNILAYNYGYWRLSWFTNLNTNVATNLLIRAWAKPKRQG